MDIEILDRSRMAILLLERCNFDCPYCCRVDEPMPPGYQLSSEQLRSCLSDCQALASMSWFHFTGGEPTLWAEDGRDLVDLLLVVSDVGFIPSFQPAILSSPTNGARLHGSAICQTTSCRPILATMWREFWPARALSGRERLWRACRTSDRSRR